jgi:hypothetical protein
MPPWAGHLWLLEADVGWTGDLVGALLSTLSTPREPPCDRENGAEAAAAAAAGAGAGGGREGLQAEGEIAGSSGGGEPDWVAFNTQRADAGWRWFAVRNARAGGEVWRGYRHACRASRRLLRALASELRAGRVQSDEAGAASVCAAAGWCASDAGWQPGHPVIGTHPDTGEALYRWEAVISPELWGRVSAADAAARNCTPAAGPCGGGGGVRGGGAARGCSRLYHGLKW